MICNLIHQCSYFQVHSKQFHSTKAKTKPRRQTRVKKEKKIVKEEPVQEEVRDTLNEDGRYPCQFCDATFSSTCLLKLRKHEYRIHGINRSGKLCEKCNTPFTKMHRCYRYKKRTKINLNLVCEECGKKYSQKADLKIHIMSVHRNEKPFKCKNCDKAFSGAKTLSDHQRQAHDRQICKICDRSLQNVLYLRRHMVFDHDETNGAIFCDICPKKVFFSLKMLDTHNKRFHSDMK